MFWEGVSALLDLFALWLGSALLFLIPLGIGLGVWHAAVKGLEEIGKCFAHVFTMHKPEEGEEEIEVLLVDTTATKDSK